MPYDRDKAITYAKTYWTIPCSDGFVGIDGDHKSISRFRQETHAPAPDWTPLFVRDFASRESGVFRKPGEKDKTFAEQKILEDCAHYVSQCLLAGGAGIKIQWGAKELKDELQGAAQTKTLIERVSQAAGQRIIDAGLLKTGDAVIYWNTKPSEGTHVGFAHSAMYVGDNGITCHSTCRYKGLGDSTEDEWHLDGGAIYEYTFIHFSSDDFLAADMAKALAGWWKVEYGGRTSYRAVKSNGTAHTSQMAPKRATDHAPATPSAYWFQDMDSIYFTWKENGDLEEWTIRMSDKAVISAELNGGAGKAVKLF
jgi:hypothetical protein